MAGMLLISALTFSHWRGCIRNGLGEPTACEVRWTTRLEPDETGYRFIGKPMPRKEDERLITGKGRFTDDFNLDGQAYAVMVRSPYPHARIVAIDAAAAKAMPGVLGVFTGADCVADKVGPIPHDPVPKTKFDMKLTGPWRQRCSPGRTCAVAGRTRRVMSAKPS